MKEARHESPQTVTFHLYETSRIGKFGETKEIRGYCELEEGGSMELLLNDSQSLWGDF